MLSVMYHVLFRTDRRISRSWRPFRLSNSSFRVSADCASLEVQQSPHCNGKQNGMHRTPDITLWACRFPSVGKPQPGFKEIRGTEAEPAAVRRQMQGTSLRIACQSRMALLTYTLLDRNVFRLVNDDACKIISRSQQKR